MDNTLVIFGSIALAAAAALFVILSIVALRAMKDITRMTSTLERVGLDISEIKTSVLPLISETTQMVRKTEQTIEQIDNSLQRISRGTQAFEKLATDIQSFEQELVGKIRVPVEDLLAAVSGGIKGLSSMLKRMFGL